MTTCKGCGRHLDAEDLVRHERGRFVVVHCPDCKCQSGDTTVTATTRRRTDSKAESVATRRS
ncbi:hypothetical protein [Halorussus caseinilyticus]|uniref:Uncharacterized protein n=1 Tax=Halorussus caseinilyticus TaxID=3034025 RepID=A0ABD5WQF8_9EURY